MSHTHTDTAMVRAEIEKFRALGYRIRIAIDETYDLEDLPQEVQDAFERGEIWTVIVSVCDRLTDDWHSLGGCATRETWSTDDASSGDLDSNLAQIALDLLRELHDGAEFFNGNGSIAFRLDNRAKRAETAANALRRRAARIEAMSANHVVE